MIISRGARLIRTLITIKRPINMGNGIEGVRNSGTWSYRVNAPPASRKTKIMAEFVSAFMWWWILWHLFTEPEHITGEFPYPNPSKWTDEELGIPN